MIELTEKVAQRVHSDLGSDEWTRAIAWLRENVPTWLPIRQEGNGEGFAVDAGARRGADVILKELEKIGAKPREAPKPEPRPTLPNTRDPRVVRQQT